tara:strand:- start:34 stop:606 length:573 start_codon:yes stop_codon:yes gene_type:complete
MLSDVEIHEAIMADYIQFDPLPPDDAFQPASVDVRLGHQSPLVWGHSERPHLQVDVMNPDPDQPKMQPAEDFGIGWPYVLEPTEFILASIHERLILSKYVACRIEGKSSIGRHGIGVHITAGFVDPGWDGNLTIELYNFGKHAFVLTPEMPIAQLAFDRFLVPARRKYGDEKLKSRYQGDDGPSASRGIG